MLPEAPAPTTMKSYVPIQNGIVASTPTKSVENTKIVQANNGTEKILYMIERILN